MISAYRIVRPEHELTAFGGEGSRLYGGRWNSEGHAVVYAAGSVSLAAMELLVHLKAASVLDQYRLAHIHLDEADVLDLDPALLPQSWRGDPRTSGTRDLGDEWVASGQSVALRVPSVIITSETNILLNPMHPRFRNVGIDPFESFAFDPRLLKK